MDLSSLSSCGASNHSVSVMNLFLTLVVASHAWLGVILNSFSKKGEASHCSVIHVKEHQRGIYLQVIRLLWNSTVRHGSNTRPSLRHSLSSSLNFSIPDRSPNCPLKRKSDGQVRWSGRNWAFLHFFGEAGPILILW